MLYDVRNRLLDGGSIEPEMIQQLAYEGVQDFLKENPRFTGQGYKVVSTGKPDGGTGTAQTANDMINSSIRSAFGR